MNEGSVLYLLRYIVTTTDKPWYWMRKKNVSVFTGVKGVVSTSTKLGLNMVPCMSGLPRTSICSSLHCLESSVARSAVHVWDSATEYGGLEGFVMSVSLGNCPGKVFTMYWMRKGIKSVPRSLNLRMMVSSFPISMTSWLGGILCTSV